MAENKKKASAGTEAENPIQYFVQNGFGLVNAYMSQKIHQYCEEFTEHRVLKAMQIANEKRIKNWGYVEKLLLHLDDSENQLCLTK